jgi:hypothetical protein
MPLETHNIFPPSKGLYDPHKAFNPLQAAGRATELHNWRIRNSTLHLLEGVSNQADQSLDNSLNNKLLLDYKSSSDDDIIYINAQSLRYIVRGGSETQVSASFLSADNQNRLGWVRFRNRILISTPADGLNWYDPANHTYRKAGVIVPDSGLTAASGSSGNLTGLYLYKYTTVNDQGHESNPSPVSNTLSSVSSKQIDLSVIDVGPTGTSSRKIYRTAAGGASYLFLTTIANNSATTYTDNIVDSSLGVLLEEDNDIPQDALQQIFADASRVYIIQDDGNTLWASKIDATTGEPQWEAFPSTLNLDIPFVGGNDKMKCGFFLGEDGFIMGRFSIYKIVGDVGAGVTLIRLPYEMGILTPFAFVNTPIGVVFLNNVKQLMTFNGTSPPVNVGKDIQATLDAISPDGSLDGPDFTFDPIANSVYINYAKAAGANTHGVMLNLDDLSLTTQDWGADLTYYSESENTLYIAKNADSTLKQWSTDFRDASAQFSPQRITWFAWSPEPGKLIDFNRIRIIGRTKSVSSNVPPTLRVEFAFDGSDLYQTRFIDLTEDYLIHGEGGGPVSVTKDIGVFRKARYLTIRISTVDNVASINDDMEIYSVQVLTQGSTEVQTHGTIQGEDDILPN